MSAPAWDAWLAQRATPRRGHATVGADVTTILSTAIGSPGRALLSGLTTLRAEVATRPGGDTRPMIQSSGHFRTTQAHPWSAVRQGVAS